MGISFSIHNPIKNDSSPLLGRSFLTIINRSKILERQINLIYRMMFCFVVKHDVTSADWLFEEQQLSFSCNSSWHFHCTNFMRNLKDKQKWVKFDPKGKHKLNSKPSNDCKQLKTFDLDLCKFTKIALENFSTPLSDFIDLKFHEKSLVCGLSGKLVLTWLNSLKFFVHSKGF